MDGMILISPICERHGGVRTQQWGAGARTQGGCERDGGISKILSIVRA